MGTRTDRSTGTRIEDASPAARRADGIACMRRTAAISARPSIHWTVMAGNARLIGARHPLPLFA